MTRRHCVTLTGIPTLMLLMTGCHQQLLDEYNRVAQANFAAACSNVIRQVDAKRITMFAVVPVEPSTQEIGGYQVEIVADPTIIRNHEKFSGAYHNHHNGLVLSFAAVQVLEGDRELGLFLIRTLATIDPDYESSSPSIGNRSIQRILQGVEANEGMQDFLEDERLQWEHKLEEYGSPDTSAE